MTTIDTPTNKISKLQQATQMIVAQYGEITARAFQGPEVETLSEGFSFLRLQEIDLAEICVKLGLNKANTELGIMLLNAETSGGKGYSQPHQHADSTTYVYPLNDGGGTYLQGETTGILNRVDGECVINGSLPHAFAVNDGMNFMAAIAVSGAGELQPIHNSDGTYNTQILKVKEVTPEYMTISS